MKKKNDVLRSELPKKEWERLIANPLTAEQESYIKSAYANYVGMLGDVHPRDAFLFAFTLGVFLGGAAAAGTFEIEEGKKIWESIQGRQN
jgi:hypothetical protein